MLTQLVAVAALSGVPQCGESIVEVPGGRHVDVDPGVGVGGQPRYARHAVNMPQQPHHVTADDAVLDIGRDSGHVAQGTHSVVVGHRGAGHHDRCCSCLLYTSDAADD